MDGRLGKREGGRIEKREKGGERYRGWKGGWVGQKREGGRQGERRWERGWEGG